MPLSVFAALNLRPGPDSSGAWLNGSVAVAPIERGAPGGREERRRRGERLEVTPSLSLSLSVTLTLSLSLSLSLTLTLTLTLTLSLSLTLTLTRGPLATHARRAEAARECAAPLVVRAARARVDGGGGRPRRAACDGAPRLPPRA